MTTLSPSQLRAARALLNWSRAELAKRSGVSEPTLHRIENGDSEANKRTLEKLYNVFDRNGVAFTDDQGVKFKPQNIEIFEGPDRFEEFYDFLYHHMLDQGGQVCLSVVDERLLAKYRKNPEVQRQRMRELVKSGYVSYRVLVTICDYSGDYVEYRQQPAHAAAPTAFYAFGECLALISFPQKKAPHVVVIRSEPLTQAYRQSFNTAWAVAKVLKHPLPKTKTTQKT